MSKFEKYLPKPKPKDPIPKAVMVRFDSENLAKFVQRKSELHQVSLNQICIAILWAAMKEDEQEIL